MIKRLFEGEIDYVTFTSASTADHFFQRFSVNEIRKMKSRFVSIGPVTSQTIAHYGLKPYREAKEHTIPGLIEVLANDAK